MSDRVLWWMDEAESFVTNIDRASGPDRTVLQISRQTKVCTEIVPVATPDPATLEALAAHMTARMERMIWRELTRPVFTPPYILELQDRLSREMFGRGPHDQLQGGRQSEGGDGSSEG
jgi:hypothetical protein